jgi:hypothetical protein
LLNVEKESKVNDLVENLKDEIKKLKSDYKNCAIKGYNLIEKTKYEKGLTFSIRNNQTIDITITRTTNGKDTVTWTRTFKTPIKSPWHIMYGFTFVPNIMNPVTNYFSKADTSGKRFTITKLNNQRNDFLKNISPTIMLQWAPLKKYTLKDNWKSIFSNNFYQLGFVSGLSLNFASETGTVNVMAGPSLVIADNISLSGGVVLTQKSILKGQYKEGDIIKENLDFDQLHEKKYMAEWFISLAIRFDSNPFKKEEEKK